MKRRIGETQGGRATAPASVPGAVSGGRAGSVIALQRMAGNRAIAGLMRDATGSARDKPPEPKPTVAISVKGHKQGLFKGSLRDGWFPAWDFVFALRGSRDKATGAISGERVYDPITLTKKTDGASPQFVQALTNNEAIDEVKIQFLSDHANASGSAAGPVETITLGGAAVVGFEQDAGHQAAGGTDKVEIAFTSVVITNEQAKTSASDRW